MSYVAFSPKQLAYRLNRILPNYKTIRRVQIRREKLARNGTQKVTRHKEEADPPDESFNTKETSK